MAKGNLKIMSTHPFLVYCIMFCCLLYSDQLAYANTFEDGKVGIHSIDDVINWSGNNLRYQNDDLWDEAPPVEEIVKKGYGDCKMLAGVVSELLNYVGVQNWIITIKRKKMYHMFNVYNDSSGTMRVVENARLLPQSFNSFDEIARHFKVDRFVAKYPTYAEFRIWYNTKVYKHK